MTNCHIALPLSSGSRPDNSQLIKLVRGSWSCCAELIDRRFFFFAEFKKKLCGRRWLGG